MNVYAKNIVSNLETAYLGLRIRTAQMPVQVTRAAEIGQVLAPLSSSVYQLSVDRVQAMKFMVSPCQGELSWGILDSQGRPVQTFEPSASSQPMTRPESGTGQVAGRSSGPLASPDIEYLSSVPPSSTVGIIVKNKAHRPAKFELYASSAHQDQTYPTLPVNKRVRVVRTTRRVIEVAWDRVPAGSQNITYCVLYYPSEQS